MSTPRCSLRLFRRPVHAPRRTSGRGFSLIAVLLMLVALAFLALGGAGVSVMQERMAGNARDRNLALQAAEATLRDAEADVQANLTADSAFAADCAGGLCIPPSMIASGPASAQRWRTMTWGSTNSRAYGSATGATSLPGLAAQPRYIVELLPVLPPSTGESAHVGSPSANAQAFRITARAVGLRDTTVVFLQSTYIKQ